MARALGEGTGAARADVWVRVGGELRPEATWPEDAEPPGPRPVSSVEEGVVTGASMVEPVRHRAELLGALGIEKRPGESMTTTEEKLVQDLAAQAGLVMRNAALTEDYCFDTIEQLRMSRQRLVTAQDEERRKLERNLHDGAQQQLVAIDGEGRAAGTAGGARSNCGGPVDRRAAAGGRDRGARGAAGSGPRDLSAAARRPGVDRGPPVAGPQVSGVGHGGGRRGSGGTRARPRRPSTSPAWKLCRTSRSTPRPRAPPCRSRTAMERSGSRSPTTEWGSTWRSSSYGDRAGGIADRLAALDGIVQITSSPGAGTQPAPRRNAAGRGRTLALTRSSRRPRPGG